MKEDKMDIQLGKTVRRLRESKQLSQKELADRSGINLKIISDLESGIGISLLSFETFINIAFALRMRPSEVLEELEKNN